jgi:hypothetical protein
MWNCEGVENALEYVPLKDFSQCGIWVLTETFTTKPVEIDGYFSYHTFASRVTRLGRHSGGVSVFIATNIARTSSVLMCGHNILALSSEGFNIVAMYSSPAADFDAALESLADAFALLDLSKPSVFAADMNCRIDLPSLPARSRAIIATLADFGFVVLNDPSLMTYVAHQGSSAIDLFATNNPRAALDGVSLVSGLVIPHFRRHRPVQMTFHLQLKLAHPSSPPPRLSKHIDTSGMETQVQDLISAVSATQPDPEALSADIATMLVRAATAPPRAPRRSPTWFDADCYRARQTLLTLRDDAGSDSSSRSRYISSRTLYKGLITRKKKEWVEREERLMIMRAESEPYQYKQTAARRVQCPIPPEIMCEHFQNIANGISTVPTSCPTVQFVGNESHTWSLDRLNADFTAEEVAKGIRRLKNNKAEGVDQIRNEHLKEADLLVPLWTALFNACLRTRSFPLLWTTCILSILYKGKGILTDPSSWRGISKKCVPGKLLGALVSNRLFRFMAANNAIPQEQHGFIRGRSTTTAITQLLNAIRLKLAVPRRPLYAVFIDFKSAFDTVSREAIIGKLAELGMRGDAMGLLVAMLRENLIIMDDGSARHPPFLQKTGLPQGDTISSILFVIALYDLPKKLLAIFPNLGIILYADDLVLYASSIAQLNGALQMLSSICQEVGLQVNMSKTVAMKFRRGGRLAASDRLVLGTHNIPFVPQVNYLGFLITATAGNFSNHIAERHRKAVIAISSLPDLRRISLDTALSLFSLKIAPIASYGIRCIWTKLKLSDLMKLDRVKTTFIKRALGVHKLSRNRLVYLLADVPSFIEDLIKIFKLPATHDSDAFLDQLQEKFARINPDFLTSPAMTTRHWRASLVPNRHAFCRASLHGFHHRFCSLTHFHEQTDECSCRFCDGPCDLYHMSICPSSPYSSLMQLANTSPSHLDQWQ